MYRKQDQGEENEISGKADLLVNRFLYDLVCVPQRARANDDERRY